MAAASEPNQQTQTVWSKLVGWIAPLLILLIAGGILFLIAGNWNTWASDSETQNTDDAYVRADLTPLSTKIAGLVAAVPIADYQTVKAGDLLVRLQDDDFKAQIDQAEAAVTAAQASIVNNQRQKLLQDARIAQSESGTRSAEADIAAAEAGIEAANAAVATARSGITAAQADVERTQLERSRQEALFTTESATKQKVEQVVADEERYRAQLASRNSDLASAMAQLSSRKADLTRARARLDSTKDDLEASKRQHGVLESQELLLSADLTGKRAAVELTRTNLGYTRIVAPEDGTVSERKVRPGQLVSPGTQVIALVQRPVWIEANFKETQLRRIVAGLPAEIHVDAFPGVAFRGKVEQLSPASGSQFALLPPDNATGNFTKIVQRVPVKIVLDPGQQGLDRLRPGLSVVAKVHTTGGAK